MGDIKPLGSEKLQGMDKIQRILEIARFNENKPARINETSKNEYGITLSDGQEYQIVKEKVGYIIKKTISESETDYIEPMRNRKYYPSYSQALKRLNLMAKETNTLTENKEGISLFSEQKKFVLKTPEKKAPEPTEDVENVPPPAPAPMPDAGPSPEGGEMSPTPSPEGGEEPMGPEGDEPMGSEGDEGEEPMGGEENEDVVSFKTIQKLVGKLGQKLRALESQGDEPMSSKDIKYVINSVLSALDLSMMDSDDIEEITSKFEDVEGQEGGEDDGSEEPMDDEEPMGPEGEGDGEDVNPEGGEMGESWGDLGLNTAGTELMKGIMPGEHKEEMDHYHKIGMIADEVFTESKVENILANYFVVSENEKKFKSQMGLMNHAVKKEERKNITKEIKRLSENVIQEIGSRKFLQENKDAKFVGKSNKKNLVFELGNKQYKVSPEGNLI